jgi:hypothetical protein
MATYTGTVRDANGNGIPGARIRHLSDCKINDRRCGCGVATKLTDGNGRFAITLRPEALARAHEFQCTYGEDTQYGTVDVSSHGGIVDFGVGTAVPDTDADTGTNDSPDSSSSANVAHVCGAHCKTKDSGCDRHTTNPAYCWQHNHSHDTGAETHVG